MTRLLAAALLVAFLTACGATLPITADVPVVVECKVEIPPPIPAPVLPENADVYDEAKVMAADRKRHIAREAALEKIVQACQH